GHDARGEVFCLGVILYELLTGRRSVSSPPSASDWPIPSLAAALPELPDDVDRAVLRLLERKPEQRFASAAEALAALPAPELGRADLVRRVSQLGDGRSGRALRIGLAAVGLGLAASLGFAGGLELGEPVSAGPLGITAQGSAESAMRATVEAGQDMTCLVDERDEKTVTTASVPESSADSVDPQGKQNRYDPQRQTHRISDKTSGRSAGKMDGERPGASGQVAAKDTESSSGESSHTPHGYGSEPRESSRHWYFGRQSPGTIPVP
ncbi:MAG: hypothetical protein AAGC55_22000, partial [Myxococcota bacterium]